MTIQAEHNYIACEIVCLRLEKSEHATTSLDAYACAAQQT